MSTSKIIVTSMPGGTSAIADHLAAGEHLVLEENHIISNKQLTLSFKKESFSENDVIRLGHGQTLYTSSYLELTATHIRIYEYLVEPTLKAELSHELDLKDHVNISINVGYGTAEVILSSAGMTYSSGVIESCWSGRNGEIFAVSKCSELYDVKMHWHCKDFENEIWLFGDSYFSHTSNLRWPSYLIKNGYTKHLLSGYPGRNSSAAIKDFKQVLTHGKPKYAVWCLGMNDEDSDSEINASYLIAVTEFLQICRDNGIIPILSTIPCVPERSNLFKNDLVRSSGVRYVDFAKAVGGEELGSHWYEGMLSSDNVHPDALGAQALYAQFINDFPEIMR